MLVSNFKMEEADPRTEVDRTVESRYLASWISLLLRDFVDERNAYQTVKALLPLYHLASRTTGIESPSLLLALDLRRAG